MNPSYLRNTNFDSVVSLPVDDTVATIPPLLDAESYLCSDSPISQVLPSVNRSYYGIVISDTFDSPFKNGIDSNGIYCDTEVPESQLIDSDETILSEMGEMELLFGWNEPIVVTALSIEFKVDAYLSTLRMMVACFLPNYIAKDAIVSPYYPAPVEIKEFLASSTS